MLDLLKGQRLFKAVSMRCAPEKKNARGFGKPVRTLSFSTMAETPRTEADSKVSMDCSRYPRVSNNTPHLGRPLGTYVERGQSLAVSVELVVVKLDKLLYCLTLDTTARRMGNSLLHTGHILEV